jgi:tetratricopeptide (TPR) repeat protein
VPKLVIFRGDAVENEIRLSGNTLRIGRHNRNDVVLDDSANGVSRFHAEIRPEGASYVIVDLNSRNGIWIGGRRIKEKAALNFGVPVTVGGFELTIEDDATSGEFDPSVLSNNAPTMVAAGRRDGSGHSASRPAATPSPGPANRRQMYLWTSLGAVLLAIGIVTFAVVRYKTRPAPVVEKPAQQQPVVEVTTTTTAPPPVDPDAENKRIVAQHIEDAKTQIAANDQAGALRDHIQPALELDPDNADALELKKQVEQAIAAAQAQREKRAALKTDPAANEPETPGISRKTGESYADYAARAKRVQSAYADGKASFDRNEYGAALTHFRAVASDQPRYQNVDSLISETLARQQKAVDDAVTSGQQNENAGKFRDARLWYQKALDIDPTATAARTKAAAMRERMTADATTLFTKASAAEKIGEASTAASIYKQIVEMMLPGDEIRDRADKAAKRLESTKR